MGNGYSDTVHEGALAELGCLLARAPLATIKVCTSQAENSTVNIPKKSGFFF